MTFVVFVVAVQIGLMLAEWRLSSAHERRLRLDGAVTPAGDPYVAMAVLYPAAFLIMGFEGAWRASSWSAPTSGGPAWPASGVLLFVASKALKYWAISSLGDRWSFKVLVQPGRPLVTAGPYRYVSHPNYMAVVGELASAAMMVGARWAGPVMMAVFGAVLWRRVRVESRALASAIESGDGR